MATITGQKALVTRYKKAIAGFKIREGMAIGCTVTLRGDRMYSFLERFINLALPRIRDFRGVNPKSFDGRGNYTLGVKEQLIFPEISFDKICLLYTSDAADEGLGVDLGGRRIIKKNW